MIGLSSHPLRLRSITATGLLHLATGLPLSAQAARFTAVRDTIRQVMKDEHIASVSVAVAKDGAIIWEESFGWANVERKIAATPGTRYSLASISKPFTATALMVLAERSQIQVERPANAYLAPTGRLRAFAGDPDQATIERLLTHTAGLPLHYQFFYADGADRPPVMDTTIARYGILVHPPGARYTYSNLGYGILGYIVARSAGKPFGEFLADEVLKPLGLTQSSVDVPAGTEDSTAVRYRPDASVLPDYTFDHIAASAVYSSAHDLVRFGMFHLGDRVEGVKPVLRPETIRQMQRSVAPEAPGLARGLGWAIIENDRGYRRIYHTGSMPGVATILNLYPTEDLAVVVLMNAYSTPSRARIADQITAAILPGFAAAMHSAPARPVDPSGVPTELEGQWNGRLVTYQGSSALALSVQKDGTIRARLGSQPESMLEGVGFVNGALTGRWQATIPTTDAARYPHAISIELTLSSARLTGWAAATDSGPQAHFALSSWVELTRR